MDKNRQRGEFEKLLERNRGRFAAIVKCYSVREEHDDLLQEILLQIWRGLPGFAAKSNIDTWCYRVALNTAISWRRRAKRRQENQPTEVADLALLAGAGNVTDEVELLERFVRRLPELDRALVLMYLDDRPNREIADTLGLSEGAVRVRIHRIKRRLAEGEANEP